jgi:transposase InsO family protein
LHDKSIVQDTFKKFAKRAQNKFEIKIERIRSDNGTELKNTNIEEFLNEERIGHEFSVPYTPQQNGIVERKNRTLIEAARTMLDEYEIPDHFWADAINTSCHAINHLYLQKILNKTHTSFYLVKNLTCLILEFLEVSASFLTRSPKTLSLLLKLMKVFFLVMPQMLMVVVSLAKPLVVLKLHVM